MPPVARGRCRRCCGGVRAAAAGCLPAARRRAAYRNADRRERFRYDVEIDDPGTYLLRVEQRGLDLIVSVETPGRLRRAPSTRRCFATATKSCCSARPRPLPRRRALRESTPAPRRPRHHAHAARAARLARARGVALVGAAARREFRRRRAGLGAGRRRVRARGGAVARARPHARGGGRAVRGRDDPILAAVRVERRRRARGARGGAVRQLGEAALAANARHLQGAAIVEQALEAQQSPTDAAVAPETEALFAEALRLARAGARRPRAARQRLRPRAGRERLRLHVLQPGRARARARATTSKRRRCSSSVDEWGAQVRAAREHRGARRRGGPARERDRDVRARCSSSCRRALANDRAIALGNLGATQRMLGNLDEALQTFAAALDAATQARRRARRRPLAAADRRDVLRARRARSRGAVSASRRCRSRCARTTAGARRRRSATSATSRSSSATTRPRSSATGARSRSRPRCRTARTCSY